MAASLTPAVLSTFEQQGLNRLIGLFVPVHNTAVSLFAIIAVIELGIFGLMWAYRNDANFGNLMFKIIKLGVIFFVISSYPYILKHLIDGFTFIAGHDNKTWSQYLFNPAKLWEFGFDGAIILLKLAVYYGTGNLGMSLIFLVMGFGVFFGFVLIGAQVILTLLGFYIVSLLALLLLPLGTFTVSS